LAEEDRHQLLVAPSQGGGGVEEDVLLYMGDMTQGGGQRHTLYDRARVAGLATAALLALVGVVVRG
jgi:hypothetical protein